jgi:hypothetical protein
MQVGAVGNGVARIYADAKSDASVERLITIIHWDLLLDLNGTPHRSVNAVEHDEQRVAGGLDDLAAEFADAQTAAGWWPTAGLQRRSGGRGKGPFRTVTVSILSRCCLYERLT